MYILYAQSFGGFEEFMKEVGCAVPPDVRRKKLVDYILFPNHPQKAMYEDMPAGAVHTIGTIF